MKNFKLVILGPENSGKSALVTQFLDNRFVEDYEPTKISYTRKSFGVLGQKVLLDFEEFGPDAQESFKEKCYKDADGFLIVFSVNDLKSFEEAQEFREQIVKIRQDETIPFILVGNKVDLEERQVKVGQALAKATDWNVWYMETSAKTRKNVCKVFINVMNKMIEKQRIQAIPVDDKEEEEEDSEEEEEDSEEEEDEPGFDLFEKTVVGRDGGKFKKYMKVQTLSNGSKVKTILEPDDPILDEYEIKKQHLATGKRTFKTKPSPTAKLALRRRLSPMLSDDDDNNDRPGPAKKPRNDRGDRNERNDRGDRNERNDRGDRNNGRNDRNNGRPERTNDRGGDRNDRNNDRGDGRNERQQHHCDICDKKFKGAQNLADHKRAKHPPPPPPNDLRKKLGPKWQWPKKSKNKSGAEIRRRRQEKENSGGKNFFDCNNCHFTFN